MLWTSTPPCTMAVECYTTPPHSAWQLRPYQVPTHTKAYHTRQHAENFRRDSTALTSMQSTSLCRTTAHTHTSSALHAICTTISLATSTIIAIADPIFHHSHYHYQGFHHHHMFDVMEDITCLSQSLYVCHHHHCCHLCHHLIVTTILIAIKQMMNNE